jgi:PAS domain S-box-containing protein
VPCCTVQKVSHDEDGEFELLRSTLRSETPELDSRSAALRRMVAQLVLDTTNAGIWLIDAQARTTFVNRHAAQLLGYSEDEMIGMRIFEFMDEGRRAVAQENLTRRQSGIEERLEAKFRRKDGSHIWVICSANPVYDRHGRYAGALAVVGDLASQKEVESRLRSQVKELRGRLVQKVLENRQRNRPAAPASISSADGGEGVSLAREAIRSAAVVAVCGTFLGVVALLTAGSVVSAALGRGAMPPETSDFSNWREAPKRS